MNNRKVFTIVLTLCLVGSFTVISNDAAYAARTKKASRRKAKAKAEAAAKAKAATPITVESEATISKKDILERLNNIFQYNDDIRGTFQGIAPAEGSDGTRFTLNGTPLVDIDKETLLGMLRTANGQLSMKNFQKLQRQLRNLKQIENMNRTQRTLKQLRDLNKKPGAPKIYTPPKIYKAPKKY